MAWTVQPIIDKLDNKFGVVATIPFDTTTVLIWQDTTNPPQNLLDMDSIRQETAGLSADFYAFPERHIFAEVINNA